MMGWVDAMKRVALRKHLAALLLAACLCGAAVPAGAAPAGGTVSPAAFQAMADSGHAADFSFGAIQTLRGIFSTAGFYVTMPEYTRPERAVLRVSYTCSDLILGHLSSLTFSLNGTPFYSCPVSYSPEGPTVLYVEVPLSLFQDAFNRLEIGSYVRLTEEEGCADDYMGANWINLEEQTALRIGYTLLEDRNLLSFYPYPFLSLLDPTGEKTSVVVSDAMDEGELAAALLALANLGAHVASPYAVDLSAIGSAAAENWIVFSLWANLPEAYRQFLPEGPVPADRVEIRRAELDGRELLLVIGGSADALMEGSRLLGDASRVQQLDTDAHAAQVGEAAVLLRNAMLSDTIVQGQHTLKDIAGGGIRLTGPFHQEATVHLPVPGDYVLSAESKFTLRYRYSENLDFTRSLITVFWGDIPIASKKLTPEGASGDTLTFAPPADLVGQSGSYLRIAFDLEVKDLICTPRQTDMPWAYVSEDSTLFLPLGKAGALNLANRPAPFQRDGRLNDILAVIPDAPGAEDLRLLGRALLLFGAGSDAYGTLRVARAGNINERDVYYNLITVGTPTANAFIRRVNGQLHFAFEEGFDRFASNEKLIFDDAYAQKAGSVQLLPSPLSDGRALLVLTAPAEEGLARLARFLSEEPLRWGLQYDAALIDARARTAAFAFTDTDTQIEERPSIGKTITQNKQNTVFTLVAVGVIGILLLAVALVLLRARRRRGD